MRGEAERAINELGLLPHCAIFVGDRVGGEELRNLLAHSWDLEGIDGRHRSFLEEHAPLRLC